MSAYASNPRTYPEATANRLLRDPPFVHALYDRNFGLSFNGNAPFSHISHTESRQDQLYMFPSNPYPSPSPPLPIAHKVWILDCKACDTFLTNRGMKAVLLLRPNVSLYSSDALPVNCSPYSSSQNRPPPQAPCRPSSSHVSSRTCECLTQTLYCHGCGTSIGYMIVIPCMRCTSSAMAFNRATNGHRFVFHSSEVVATARRWVVDEPGIAPCDPIPLVTPAQSTSPPYSRSYGHRPGSSSPAPLSDYLPTPPLELADPARLPAASDAFPFPHDSNRLDIDIPHPQNSSHSQPHLTYTPFHEYHPAEQISNSTSEPTEYHPPPSARTALSYGPAEQKDQRPPHKLQSGDVLYWHHLSRSGEISGVNDDERARGEQPSTVGATAASGRRIFRFNR